MIKIKNALILFLLLVSFQAVAEPTAKIGVVDAESVLFEFMIGKHGEEYFMKRQALLEIETRLIPMLMSTPQVTLYDITKFAEDQSQPLKEASGKQSPEMDEILQTFKKELLSQVQQYCRSKGISFAYIRGKSPGSESLYYLDENIEDITAGVVQQIKNNRSGWEPLTEEWKTVMKEMIKRREDQK